MENTGKCANWILWTKLPWATMFEGRHCKNQAHLKTIYFADCSSYIPQLYH